MEDGALQTLLGVMNVDATVFAICIVAVLVGAFVKGYSGFGASMLWVTSLSLVLPPLEVVPMVLLFEVVSSIHLLPFVRREIEWRSVRTLLIGTWLATPIGIYALASVPADPIRIALGLVVLGGAVAMWRGFALQSVPGPAATVGVGALSGLLNGSMGFVGPPVILFYFSSPIGTAMGRASIIAYFLGTDSVAVGLFAVQGLIPAEVMVRTAAFLPFLFLGVWLGNRQFIHAEPDSFRRFALALLIFLSLALMARAVWM